MDQPETPDIHGLPLICACGCQQFDVGQYTYNTQRYDAATDEWGSSKDFCDDKVVLVTCAECRADCTKLAWLAGRFDLYHDAWAQQTPLTSGRRRLPAPRAKIHGLFDTRDTRPAHWVWNAEALPSGLELWRGRPGERVPLLTLTGDLATLVAHAKALYELLLDTQQQTAQAQQTADARG